MQHKLTNMWVKNLLKLSKYKQLSIIILIGIFINIGTAGAQKLDAGFVLNEMTTKQRSSYVAGVVEGLAYSRFLRDRPNEESMKCVTGWFYNDATKKWKTIQVVFKRYQDKPPAVLLYVLIKKECGA